MSKKTTLRLLDAKPKTFKDCVRLRRKCITKNNQLRAHQKFVRLQLYIVRSMRKYGHTDTEIVNNFINRWRENLETTGQVREAIAVARHTVEQIGDQMLAERTMRDAEQPA